MIKPSFRYLSRICLFLTMSYCVWACASGKSSKTEEQTLSGPVISCGHLNIYQLSEDNKSYIQLIIDTKQLDLVKENTWTISSQTEGVRIRFRQYDHEVAAALCNDVRSRKTKPLNQFNALAGAITLTMSAKDWENYRKGARYKVDLEATGLKFDNGTTYTLSISQALVGWLPG